MKKILAELRSKHIKKIAIVTDTVYPFFKGGKEKRTYEIAIRLAAQGHDVSIYSMQWWEGGKTLVRDNITYRAISPLYPIYEGDRRSIKEALFFAMHCLKMFGESFDVIEADAVPHFQLFSIKLVCFLKGKKMIVSWHEVWGKKYWQSYLGWWKGTIASYVERLSVKMPDIIISVSDHTTDALKNTLHAKQKIVMIPNGLDLKVFEDNDPSTKTSDIIFAGRLLKHKNVDVLLRAVALLKNSIPNIRLFIIGDGPERKSLEALTDTLRLNDGLNENVHFFGFLEDHNELYRLMMASKIFALPSTREGFGIAVIEANACGLPVVTIDDEHNAAKELIVAGKNGLTCTLDAAALADAIQTLLTKKEQPSEYIKYAQQYNWDNLIFQINNAYSL